MVDATKQPIDKLLGAYAAGCVELYTRLGGNGGQLRVKDGSYAHWLSDLEELAKLQSLVRLRGLHDEFAAEMQIMNSVKMLVISARAA